MGCAFLAMSHKCMLLGIVRMRSVCSYLLLLCVVVSVWARADSAEIVLLDVMVSTSTHAPFGAMVRANAFARENVQAQDSNNHDPALTDI